MARVVMVNGQSYSFPDSATDAQISDALGSQRAIGVKAHQRRGGGWRDLVRPAFENAPVLGAIGGEALAIPAAAALTAGSFGAATPASVALLAGGPMLGAAAGKGIQNLGNMLLGEPGVQSPVEQATSMAGTGALFGGLQAGATAAARQMPKVARLLAQLGAKSSPEVAQTMVEQNIPATRGGLQQVGEKIQGLERQATLIAAQARRQAIPVTLLVQRVSNRLKDAFDVPDQAERVAQFKDLMAKLIRPYTIGEGGTLSETATVSPPTLLRLRRSADRLGSDVQAKMESFRSPAEADFYSRFQRTVADVARGLLNEAAPKIRDVHRQMGKLMDVRDVLEFANPAVTPGTKATQAVLQHTPPTLLGAGLGGLAGLPSGPAAAGFAATAGAGLANMATTPAGLSALSQAANSPFLQMLLLQSPKLLGQAVQNWQQP